jgi:hypothetical protein
MNVITPDATSYIFIVDVDMGCILMLYVELETDGPP